MRANPPLADCEPLEPGKQAVHGRWEKSTEAGATWEHDFNRHYLREDDAEHPQRV
jgi:hypothetical protein